MLTNAPKTEGMAVRIRVFLCFPFFATYRSNWRSRGRSHGRRSATRHGRRVWQCNPRRSQLLRLVADKENKRKPVANSHPLDPRLFVNKPHCGSFLGLPVNPVYVNLIAVFMDKSLAAGLHTFVDRGLRRG